PGRDRTVRPGAVRHADLRRLKDVGRDRVDPDPPVVAGAADSLLRHAHYAIRGVVSRSLSGRPQRAHSVRAAPFRVARSTGIGVAQTQCSVVGCALMWHLLRVRRMDGAPAGDSLAGSAGGWSAG